MNQTHPNKVLLYKANCFFLKYFMLLYPGISIFTLQQPENKMNMIKKGLGWVKNWFTGEDQAADVLLPTGDQGTTQVRTTTNKLIDLGTRAKNVASGFVTGVVNAAKGAGSTVIDGFRAVKQKATDIVEKVEVNVAAKAVSNALQQFKTWVSEYKGLFITALVAVLALIFVPIIAALGGLFSSKATKNSTPADDAKNQSSKLDTSSLLSKALPNSTIFASFLKTIRDAVSTTPLHAKKIVPADKASVAAHSLFTTTAPAAPAAPAAVTPVSSILVSPHGSGLDSKGKPSFRLQ